MRRATHGRHLLALLSLAFLTAAVESALAETLTVPVGEARSVKLTRGANTAVVGNAETADARIAFEDTVVVVGKQHGTTNLIVYDDAGVEIYNSEINVTTPSDPNVVTLVTNVDRRLYDCTSELCVERREATSVTRSGGEVGADGAVTSATTTENF